MNFSIEISYVCVCVSVRSVQSMMIMMMVMCFVFIDVHSRKEDVFKSLIRIKLTNENNDEEK